MKLKALEKGLFLYYKEKFDLAIFIIRMHTKPWRGNFRRALPAFFML